MVAAAKLRRAQEAAEAARPYAERFNAVLGGLAASVRWRILRPKLLAGTGSDQTHLLVCHDLRTRPVRWFQHANIAKLARAKATEL